MWFLIDTSYTVFYRYHALKLWSSHALKDSSDDDKKKEILNKFQQKYLETMINICKKIYQTYTLEEIASDGGDDGGDGDKKKKRIRKPKFEEKNHRFIWCRDGSRSDLWRTEIYPEYKKTRVNDCGVGQYFHETTSILDKIKDLNNHSILRHPHLEGDDLLYLVADSIGQGDYSDRDIAIISSDQDLLQIKGLESKYSTLKIRFWNCQGGGKQWGSKTGNWELDLFRKIIGGDTSDNIPKCIPRLGLKKIDEMFATPELLEDKLKASDPTFKKKYLLNQRLVDFRMIPEALQKEARILIANCELLVR